MGSRAIVVATLWAALASGAWAAGVPAAVLDTPVGADPLPAFAVSAALDVARHDSEAKALRRSLVERWLQRAEGAHDDALPPTTVGQMIAAARSVPDASRQASRWTALLERHLVIEPHRAPVPVPLELEADAARLEAVAPGIWLQRRVDGALRSAWWWLPLRHSAPTALAPDRFTIELRGDGRTAQPLRWQCALPRQAELHLLPPGQVQPFICQAQAHDLPTAPRVAVQLADLAAAPGRPLRVTLPANALQHLVQRLEGAAAAAGPLQAVPPSDRVTRATRPAASAAAGPQAKARAPVRPAPAPRWLVVLQLVGAFVSGLGVYHVLYRVGGGTFAFGLTWMASTALAVAGAAATLPALGAGLAAGSLAAGLLPLLGWVMAPVSALMLTGLLSGVHALLFGEREAAFRAVQDVAERSVPGALRQLLGRWRRR